MTKNITLTIEQARELLGKDSAIDQLIRANFTDDELNPKPKYPKRWEDLGRVDGWYVDDTADLCSISSNADDINKNTFATEQQARSFGLIYPQLTQLMKAYRGGWVPDWTAGNLKYCVEAKQGDLSVVASSTIKCPLSFQTADIAEQFMTDHRELIEEFFKGM